MRRIQLLLLVGAVVLGGSLLLTSPPADESPLAAVTPLDFLRNSFGGEEYSLPDLRYFRLAAQKVNNEYVDPTRVDPEEILGSALDRVARLVPEFLFEMEERGVAIQVVVGSESTVLPLPQLDSLSAAIGVIADVVGFLDRHLGPEIERAPIEYAIMNGMLETLDPHSVFIAPESYKEMSIQNKGHFGGLGITIGIREKRLTILYPLKDTPAWRAGLKSGDHISKIENESTVNMSLQEAVSRLRGEEGSAVTITVTDEKSPDREVTIVRARIEVPSVEWAYAGDGIGLLQLYHFSQTTYDRVEDALESLELQAMEDKQGSLRGLVLDLRQNPGGYLQQAIEVADKFIRSGVLVSTVGLGGANPEITRATRFRTEEELPVVVLVDQSSASASEIVAGALRNQDRAVVMGVRTFGKGSVQNLYDRDFHDGALKLTIAQYLTPGDLSIQGLGIQPDIELRPAIVQPSEAGEEREVHLYWQDFELREEDLDRSFAWGGNSDAAGDMLRSVYSCPECFEGDKGREREASAADHVDDVEVQAAKALLLARPTHVRSEMLKPAQEVLAAQLGKREKELETRFDSLGVDWSLRGSSGDRAAPPAATARVEVEVQSEDGLLIPGTSTPVVLRVTNEGKQPIQRLRAVTEGEFFRGKEYFLGRVEPGQTQEFSVEVKPALWLRARAYEITWHFFSEGGPKLEPFKGLLRVQDVPHPRFAFSWQIVDDGSGSSRGNGDGLLQPAEEIDLLVTVRNIGSGATSDSWLRERGSPNGSSDVSPAAGTGDPSAEEGAEAHGFVQLKNKSGESLFLVNGTADFSLEPGEQTHQRLHFRVADTVDSLESIEAELMVGDEKFYEFVSVELELPVAQVGEPAASLQRTMQPKDADVSLRAGASDKMPIVATVDGPVTVDGRLGSWLRVALPWGGSGWAPVASLAPAGRKDGAAEAPAIHLSNSPPVVTLTSNPGGTVVVDGELLVQGEVVDDLGIKDLFVFVNNRKVHYETVAANSPRQAFRLNVTLEDGENLVEVFARDGDDHLGNLSFGVYRDASTASRGP